MIGSAEQHVQEHLPGVTSEAPQVRLLREAVEFTRELRDRELAPLKSLNKLGELGQGGAPAPRPVFYFTCPWLSSRPRRK
jgi:hypothetical protein